MELPREIDFAADDDASPERMNRAMGYLLALVRAAAADGPKVAAAVEDLRRFGILRVAEVLTPVFEQAFEVRDQLQAIHAEWQLEEYFAEHIGTAETAAQLATSKAEIAIAQAAAATEAAADAGAFEDDAGGHAQTATNKAAEAIAARDSAIARRDEAIDARDAAVAARDQAVAAQQAINDANLVHRTGDENIDGIKTFAQKVLATAGIRINGVDLVGLTAAGKALVEAVDVAAQKTLLGVGEASAAGAVGSRVIAASTAHAANTGYAIGSQVAGSTLFVSNSTSNMCSLSLDGGVAGSVTAPGTNLGYSGTWELRCRVYRTSSTYPAGLWVRIA